MECVYVFLFLASLYLVYKGCHQDLKQSSRLKVKNHKQDNYTIQKISEKKTENGKSIPSNDSL